MKDRILETPLSSLIVLFQKFLTSSDDNSQTTSFKGSNADSNCNVFIIILITIVINKHFSPNADSIHVTFVIKQYMCRNIFMCGLDESENSIIEALTSPMKSCSLYSSRIRNLWRKCLHMNSF